MRPNRPQPHATANPRTGFRWVGNHLAADFANTVLSIDNKEDAIRSWGDLVAFLEGCGVVKNNQINQLKRLEAVAPQDCARALRAALDLRSGIRQGLAALANRLRVPERSAAAVNAVLRLTEGYDQLVGSGEGWKLQFIQRERRLEWLLAAIARSAAELFVAGREARVRKCANPACLLYFHDASRTGKRRWCAMARCGNRSKVAAFARRRRRNRRPRR